MSDANLGLETGTASTEALLTDRSGRRVGCCGTVLRAAHLLCGWSGDGIPARATLPRLGLAEYLSEGNSREQE